MARKLPWLSQAKHRPVDSSSERTLSKRKKQDELENEAQPKLRDKRQPARNPSSSPPPSPPKQEFMKDGLDGDDVWVMVEDEFLSTAQTFTQHLHHAQYKSLKKMVNSQNASIINSISRPTDDRTAMSIQTRKKVEGSEQRRQAKVALKNIVGNEERGGRVDEDLDSLDEEEDPWMRDSRLAGLMTRKENSTKLSKLTGIKSNTRAAAGYDQSKSPIRYQSSRRLIASQPSVDNHRKAEGSGQKSDQFGSDEDDQGEVDATELITPERRRVIISASEEDSLSHLPNRIAQSPEFTKRMAKRKTSATKQKQDEELQKKSIKLEEIPTFLF